MDSVELDQVKMTSPFKQPRVSLALSEDDSITTSPSTGNSNIKSSTECSCYSAEDAYDFVFVEEKNIERQVKCQNFHLLGYCSEGANCKFQHQERGVSQIKRDIRAYNPIHFLSEYPELVPWRIYRAESAIGNQTK